MEKVKLELVGMAFSQSQSGAYTLILGELGTDLKLPIMIGGFEAQSIALKLEGVEHQRPMTHDLIVNLLGTLNVKLERVEIVKFEEGIFFAELHLLQDTMPIVIDARTSDAVAIAIREDVSIYTTREVMDKAAVILTGENEDESSAEELILEGSESTHPDLEDFSLEKLQEMLEEEIEQEEFEKASLIQAEINKRKGK